MWLIHTISIPGQHIWKLQREKKKPKSEPNFECRIEFDLYLMVDIQFKCIACDQSIKLSNVDANATQIMNAYALTHRRPYGKCDAKFNWSQFHWSNGKFNNKINANVIESDCVRIPIILSNSIGSCVSNGAA